MKDGVLTELLEHAMKKDPIYPILNNLHLAAMNYRYTWILQLFYIVLKTCCFKSFLKYYLHLHRVRPGDAREANITLHKDVLL